MEAFIDNRLYHELLLIFLTIHIVVIITRAKPFMMARLLLEPVTIMILSRLLDKIVVIYVDRPIN